MNDGRVREEKNGDHEVQDYSKADVADEEFTISSVSLVELSSASIRRTPSFFPFVFPGDGEESGGIS